MILIRDFASIMMAIVPGFYIPAPDVDISLLQILFHFKHCNRAPFKKKQAQFKNKRTWDHAEIEISIYLIQLEQISTLILQMDLEALYIQCPGPPMYYGYRSSWPMTKKGMPKDIRWTDHRHDLVAASTYY